MEPVVLDAFAQGTEFCKWTVEHADQASATAVKLFGGTPVLLRGRYRDCLAPGKPLWEGGGFRPPARASCRALACRGQGNRDGYAAPELRFRIVRAGVPCGPDLVPQGPAKPLPPLGGAS